MFDAFIQNKKNMLVEYYKFPNLKTKQNNTYIIFPIKKMTQLTN